MSKSEKFLRINMWISKYLLIAIPFVIAVVVWALSNSNVEKEVQGIQSVLWEILSWNFLVWFVLLVYFIISLVFWEAFREKILATLTRSEERDERESYISGKASKATFYSTLAVLILFFFLSGLHLSIYKKPKEEAIDGKRGTISIGYSFEFVNSAKKNVDETPSKNEKIFSLNGVPFTQESILLFLILFHTTSYHVFTRRQS